MSPKAARSLSHRSSIDPLLLDVIACPNDLTLLHRKARSLRTLVCAKGHEFPVEGGIPILLPHGGLPGHWGMKTDADFKSPSPIDPFVQQVIGATGGFLYEDRLGQLTEYPIPHLRLPRANGELFLDVGCNWGRWSVAAARLGYRVVGVDPHLEAIQAATRVARELGVDARYVVGDARYLPFQSNSFSLVYSYSVLQHLPKDEVEMVLEGISAILATQGTSFIQMANAWGARSLYHQMCRGFRRPRHFEVRYWAPPQMKSVFNECIGPTELEVDGFFSVNPQLSDLPLLTPRHRIIVLLSALLREISRGPLNLFADSLYVKSRKLYSPPSKSSPRR